MRDVAQFVKILADEARLKILWLLFNHRELCVCDIMEALEITQSKTSRHLATLRHAGLVTDRRDGAWSHYSIRPVEGELERALLDALRARLADNKGAAEVTRKLHDWMEHKDRETACVDDCACSTPPAKAKAAPTRAPRKGGNR